MLQIKNTLGGGKPEGLYAWKKCENNTDHTFIDYVVSDKENAFPDGAVQDGYYYEKVGGGRKVTNGTVTPSGNSKTIDLDIGMNEPEVIVMIDPSSDTTNELLYFPEVGKSAMRSGKYNWGSLTVTMNGTVATMVTSNAWYGVNMTWYAISK